MHSLINKNFKYAVVGVSQNPEKYGHKVFKDLTSAGFTVYPIHPKEKEILGSKVYPKVGDVPENIDLAIFVVPPVVTLEVLKEIKDLDIKHVWFQPGSESPEAIKFCDSQGIECIHDACIMIERKKDE